MKFRAGLVWRIRHGVWLITTYQRRKKNRQSVEAQLLAERRRMWQDQKAGRIPGGVDLFARDLPFLKVMTMGDEPVVVNRRYPKWTQPPIAPCACGCTAVVPPICGA